MCFDVLDSEDKSTSVTSIVLSSIMRWGRIANSKPTAVNKTHSSDAFSPFTLLYASAFVSKSNNPASIFVSGSGIPQMLAGIVWILIVCSLIHDREVLEKMDCHKAGWGLYRLSDWTGGCALKVKHTGECVCIYIQYIPFWKKTYTKLYLKYIYFILSTNRLTYWHIALD